MEVTKDIISSIPKDSPLNTKVYIIRTVEIYENTIFSEYNYIISFYIIRLLLILSYFCLLLFSLLFSYFMFWIII